MRIAVAILSLIVLALPADASRKSGTGSHRSHRSSTGHHRSSNSSRGDNGWRTSRSGHHYNIYH